MNTSPCRIALLAAAALCILAGEALAQRLDFSGRWISAPPEVVPPAREASMQPGRPVPKPDFGTAWGRDITIRQTDQSLIVEWQPYTPYDLQPPLVFAHSLDGSETTNTFGMGRGLQQQRSTVSWNGSSLVIQTVYADSAQVSQTLTLESPSSLIVQTTTRTSGHSLSSRTVYTRKDP